MPELPDVEGFRRYLSRYASGRRIRSVRVPAPDILRNTSPPGLSRALRGRTLGRPRRRGKWLLVPARGPILILHFGMTGGLNWFGHGRGAGLHPHDRLVLEMDGGELRYRNQRKLGGVWLAARERGAERIIGPLGPDADRLDARELAEILGGRRGGLKATLMNQRVIAGIGNELSDEILWRARLDPRQPAGQLDRAEHRRLHAAMRKVLRESIAHGRIPRRRSWLTSQRGVRDPRCPRCGSGLRRMTIAGRTAYVCPRCQSR